MLGFTDKLRQAAQNRARYRRTMRDLEGLDAASLREFGITKSDFKRLARGQTPDS